MPKVWHTLIKNIIEPLRQTKILFCASITFPYIYCIVCDYYDLFRHPFRSHFSIIQKIHYVVDMNICP